MTPANIQIETPRLILRPTRGTDFDAWAKLSADAQTMEHLGGAQHRAVAWRKFLMTAGGWEIQGFAPFSVIEKSSGIWIGRIGPLQPEGWPGTEIGWTLARDAWGKGYAVEAATASADWAFAELGWTDIIHCIDEANVASRSLAEKLGSRYLREGRLPPPYDEKTIAIWGQSRDEWMARRKGKSA